MNQIKNQSWGKEGSITDAKFLKKKKKKVIEEDLTTVSVYVCSRVLPLGIEEGIQRLSLIMDGFGGSTTFIRFALP